MNKRILALVLALLTLAMIGCNQEPADVIDVLEPTPPPVVDAMALEMELPAGCGMVAAGNVHTLGVRSDGTVIVAGHNTNGQCDAKSWQDIVYAAAGDTVSIGVTSLGTVIVAGSSDLAAQTEAWTDIAYAAAGTGHVAGLKTNGTVVAAGDNSKGQCNVTAWTDIIAIAAAGNHTVGLKKDGTVVATGDSSLGQCGVTDWTEIVAIAAGADQTAAIKKDGAAVSTKNDVSAWTGIVSIAAGGTATVGVTASGTVVSVPEDAAAAAITDAASVAAGKDHAVVLKKDGSVAAFGSDSDFQCGVDGWKLSPYIDNGMVMGFAPGMTAIRVSNILKAYTGSDNIVLNKDGAAMLDTDNVVTGVEILKDGAAYGTLVIMGDVNGDGTINASDAEAVTNHISGDAALEGAFLRAASIKTDSEGKLTADCVTNIEAHASKDLILSQYPALGGNKYDDEIAEARKVNSDVVGWIAIEGTTISYPIMFNAKEAFYYNNRDLNKDKTDSGSIYAFYSKYTTNNVVTGHNSRVSQTMFHPLHHIQEYNMGSATCAYEKCSASLANAGLPDFKTYKGRIWTVNIYGVEAQWEIFSMYESTKDATYEELEYNTWYPPKKNWLDSEEKIQKWINTQLDNSDYDFGASVSPNDTFLTVYTCGNEHKDSSGGHFARLWYFLHKIS